MPAAADTARRWFRGARVILATLDDVKAALYAIGRADLAVDHQVINGKSCTCRATAGLGLGRGGSCPTLFRLMYARGCSEHWSRHARRTGSDCHNSSGCGSSVSTVM